MGTAACMPSPPTPPPLQIDMYSAVNQHGHRGLYTSRDYEVNDVLAYIPSSVVFNVGTLNGTFAVCACACACVCVHVCTCVGGSTACWRTRYPL